MWQPKVLATKRPYLKIYLIDSIMDIYVFNNLDLGCLSILKAQLKSMVPYQMAWFPDVRRYNFDTAKKIDRENYS